MYTLFFPDYLDTGCKSRCANFRLLLKNLDLIRHKSFIIDLNEKGSIEFIPLLPSSIRTLDVELIVWTLVFRLKTFNTSNYFLAATWSKPFFKRTLFSLFYRDANKCFKPPIVSTSNI